MAISATCTAAQNRGGKIFVAFGKREYEFNDMAHIRDWIRSGLSVEDLHRIIVAKAMETNNPQAIVGRTITLDLSLAANIVRIT